MKTLYLDCGMGAAGDMLAAALTELLPDPEDFIREVNTLGIPGVHIRREPSVKCGITGTHIAVTVDGIEEESVDYTGHENRVEESIEYSCRAEAAHSQGCMKEAVQGHKGDTVHEHPHSHEYTAKEYLHSHGEDVSHGHTHSHEEDTLHEHPHSHKAETRHEHPHSHEDAAQEHFHSHGEDVPHGHLHSHGGESGHEHGHVHHHSSLHDIEHIVRDHLALPAKVKEDILAVYGLIAEAESAAHGVPVTEIHFHEVGTMDAVADIAMVCLLMDRLSPDEVIASPVHVGSGQVRCAHGILPVPAPATAHILRDVPIYGGKVKGELCTPTGAALLKHFAVRFGEMPVMKLQAAGYGMGKKDFEAANCVRAMLGETEGENDFVLELSCNVDDMTAEAVGFAMECFMAGGALDAYTVSIGMKKSRPGILIRVICREQDRERMLALLFRHTSTIGVREIRMRRHVLDRSITALETPYGVVHRKESSGHGVTRIKYEYEDLAAIARERGMGIEDVKEWLKAESPKA